MTQLSIEHQTNHLQVKIAIVVPIISERTDVLQTNINIEESALHRSLVIQCNGTKGINNAGPCL